MEHQGSRRVGPPLRRRRRGFATLPIAVWIIYAGIAYMTAAFWAFAYTHRPESPVQFRDEQYDPN